MAIIALLMIAFAAAAHVPSALAAPRKAPPLVYLRDIDASITQDMRYAGRNNFTGRPLPGYDAPECMLRPAVARTLSQVQAELAAAHLSLKVYDCYRPTRSVAAMAAWSRRTRDEIDTSRFYPALNKSRLFALGYIANHSAHSRGVAVDLTLVPLGAPPAGFDPAAHYGPCTGPQIERAPDNSLDMGPGYDCFDVKSHTHNAGITPAQTANRRLLLEAMRKHGFTNYKREWWHFSFDAADSNTAYDVPIAPR
jgi:D-alanyl-D-alanine dipeptidase